MVYGNDLNIFITRQKSKNSLRQKIKLAEISNALNKEMPTITCSLDV